MINFEKQEWYDKSDSRAIPISPYNLNRFETAIGECVDSINSQTKIIFGTYTGDGAESRTIDLGVTPKAVIIDNYKQIITVSGNNRPSQYTFTKLFFNNDRVQDGFSVTLDKYTYATSQTQTQTVYYGSNVSGTVYNYIAFI